MYNLISALQGKIQLPSDYVSPFDSSTFLLTRFEEKLAKSIGSTDVHKPILQLNTIPRTIDPSNFADPFGPDNPGGSYATLLSFYNLVDPVPSFAKNYWPTAYSTDRLFGDLVKSATTGDDMPAVRQILSQAHQTYATSDISYQTGTGTRVHPAYAVPNNWYDSSRAFSSIEIDLTDPNSVEQSGFTILGGQDDTEQMNWKIGSPENPQSIQALHPDTKIECITLKYDMITIQRPWFNFEIFSISGWFIKGFPKGFYSSGTLTNNTGILSLLPTGFIVAKEVEVTAQWSDADKQVLEAAQKGDQKIALGQFSLSGSAADSFSGREFGSKLKNNTLSIPALHVIGWVSSLVPLAPKTG